MASPPRTQQSATRRHENPTRVPFEEFLASLQEGSWAEWVDGEVVPLAPASARHQRIALFLASVLSEYVRARDLGEVFQAPFVVRLPEPLRRAREPDLVFVRKDRLSLLKDTYLDGTPDLAVEITSPESLSRDRGEKFVEYEAAGIPEYWLIDPDRTQSEFYQLQPDGRYRSVPAGPEGIYRSSVVSGFWLRVEWLWRDPLPSALQVARELGVGL